MNIHQLLGQYELYQEKIRDNRLVVKDSISKNQELQKKLQAVKKKLRNEVKRSGKGVYTFCQEIFGEIDWRFHVLYALFREPRK